VMTLWLVGWRIHVNAFSHSIDIEVDRVNKHAPNSEACACPVAILSTV
jgi:hypothetical protein